MLLHVPILRSPSGSIDCSLLKLHVKNYEYLNSYCSQSTYLPASETTHTQTHDAATSQINVTIYSQFDGFGGLVVSMLASGTQVCGFKPGESCWIFTGVKILSIPSSGKEVKESVPCPSFAGCKRT